MGLAWGAFSAASAAALAATGRFMFPNVLNEPPQQFKAGFPNEYGIGVDERWKEKFGDLAGADAGGHRAARQRLLRAERHLHAPGLHAELSVGGEQVQVPVPRQRVPHRPASTSRDRRRGRSNATRIVLAEDGQILVDKSRHFQRELGQWTDPEAFLQSVEWNLDVRSSQDWI